MKVVIIGGVAGGATAAARIRRLDEQAEIVVFERSGFISYANCGLPYYIGGTIEEENDLTLQTPESFWRRFRVKMNVHHEVTAIHPDSKTVTVKNLENGKIITESYDKLVLSPGAKPIKPGFDGIDSDKIFTLRTVEDTLRLKKYTDEHHPKSAVVVGGGFIGIEVAENLRELGIDVTLVEAADQLMAPFDRDMASFIHAEIRKNSIHLMLDTMVEGFADTDCGIDVKLKSAPTLHTDMIVMAIGVAPETTLAKDAGIELGIKGSIVVNDKMETSIPDIYAVGDAVQIKNFVTDTDTLISLNKGLSTSDEYSGKIDILPSVMKIPDIPDKVILKGALVTERQVFSFGKNSNICFDENMYLGICDYEVEIEVDERDTEEALFVINYLGLAQKPIKSKSERFFRRLEVVKSE